LLKGFKTRPKNFYGYIRSLQTVKDAATVLQKPDSSLTTTDEETAEVLKNQYQKIFVTNITGGIADGPSIENVSYGSSKVLHKLQRMRTDGSPGPDGLHPMVLVICAASVAEPLAIMFQESFQSAILPSDWKSANIVPIFKQGDKTDPNNYRPVSLTSVPCKIVESIIKDSITTFLEQNHIISYSQHGFTKGRSCLANLLESLEQWTHALDNRYCMDILYLDYRKAFDSVPRQCLIHKLSTLGCQGKLLLWVKSFLYNRKMRVGVRGSYSSWFDMLSGIFQGSVLGPILFLLYVNKLPSWILSSIKMFADDSKVWSH